MNQDMTTQQPEALIFANDRPSEINDDLYQWAVDAEDMIRRLHSESELHQQELASYRFTVENREARIAELEALLKFADERINKMQEGRSAKQGVQLPEPFAYVEHHKAGDNLWFDCPCGKYSGLYTEQQVRQILAQYSIK